MHVIEIFTALCGIALLVVGYRRNQRKMMAVAGMVLMVAGATGHVADKLDRSPTAVRTPVASTPHL